MLRHMHIFDNFSNDKSHRNESLLTFISKTANLFSVQSISICKKKKLIKMRKSVSVGDVNAEMKAAAKWSRSRLVDSGIASRRIRITSMRMAIES